MSNTPFDNSFQQQPQGWPQPQQMPAQNPFQQPQSWPQQPQQQPQGWPQPQQMPAQNPFQQPQQPQQPPASGSLDAFQSQRTGGNAKGISWKGIEPGGPGSVVGVTVARDVTDADVQQDTDYQTGAPMFYRDGRPRFHLQVPVELHENHGRNPMDYPGNQATLFVRGDLHKALREAQIKALGHEEAPKKGDMMQISLVEKRDTGQGNPKNIFSVQYAQDISGREQPPAPATTEAPAATEAPAQQQAPLTPEQQAMMERLKAQN